MPDATAVRLFAAGGGEARKKLAGVSRAQLTKGWGDSHEKADWQRHAFPRRASERPILAARQAKTFARDRSSNRDARRNP